MSGPLPEPELKQIDFKPGINRELTRYAGRGGWYDGDKIRFRKGKPERIGGWVNINGADSSVTYEGIVRDMASWTALDNTRWAAWGTHKKIYIWDTASAVDITPIVSSTVIAAGGIISTSANSIRVVVSLSAHPLFTGDFILISSQTTIGENIFLSATNVEVSSIDADSFAFDNTISATNTSLSAGTSVTLQFLLPTGYQSNTQGSGWGAGVWGHSNGWGVSAPSGGTTLQLRRWSMDIWGEDLVANPAGYQIYHWDKTSGTSARLSAISGGPSRSEFIIVSPEDQHLISLGVPDITTSVYDPLYLRWCSQGNLSDWNPSATNTAGDKRLSGGTKIVGALRARGGIMLWTDHDLYLMQFIGGDFVFDFSYLGEGGLIGPHAATEAAGRLFWMSQERFMMFDGAIHTLDCSVLRYVFDNLDLDQTDKVYSGENPAWGEVLWFYQSTSSTDGEIDRYVCYNYLENVWTIGALQRTAWIDPHVFGYPLAAGGDGYIYYHEYGASANGSAFTCYLESNVIDLDGGQQLMFMDRIVPDITNRIGNPMMGNLTLTLQMQKYLNSTTVSKGPYTVSAGTQKIDMRARGRHATLRVDACCCWRLGTLRFRLVPDGEA